MMTCTDVQDELNAVEKQKNNSKMTKKWASNENHFLMGKEGEEEGEEEEELVPEIDLHGIHGNGVPLIPYPV